MLLKQNINAITSFITTRQRHIKNIGMNITNIIYEIAAIFVAQYLLHNTAFSRLQMYALTLTAREVKGRTLMRKATSLRMNSTVKTPVKIMFM